MFSNMSRTVVLGGWAFLLATIAAASIVMGAHLSTTALLVALAAAPGIIVVMLAGNMPSQTIAEVLYAVDAKDDRR